MPFSQIKRAAWDGLSLYDRPTNPFQHYSNAFVAAAVPAYARKEVAATAAQASWNACPAADREEAIRDLRSRRRKRAASNLTSWVKVAKPKADAQREPLMQPPQILVRKCHLTRRVRKKI